MRVFRQISASLGDVVVNYMLTKAVGLCQNWLFALQNVDIEATYKMPTNPKSGSDDRSDDLGRHV
jgi:hypothetical protein